MKTNLKCNAQALASLSKLAEMLDCSLARYLSNARPWRRRPYLLLAAVTRRVANEHERYAQALVQLLHERRCHLGAFTFPVEFTYYNDLSLEHLAPKVLAGQKELISIATAAGHLLAEDRDHEAQRLVDDLLASLRQYAGLMEELLAPHRVAAAAAMPEENASRNGRASSTATDDRYVATTEAQTAA